MDFTQLDQAEFYREGAKVAKKNLSRIFAFFAPSR